MSAHFEKPSKTILIYGLTGLQQLALSAMAEREGITCRTVTDNQTALTIAQLLSGDTFPPIPSSPLIGRFALLAGFNGQEQIAVKMINQVSPGVVKAVHTRHNSDWHFAELCSAIKSEHETIKKNSRK